MTPGEESRIMSALIQASFTHGFAQGVMWASEQSGVSVRQSEQIKKRLPTAMIEKFNEYVESISKPTKDQNND